MLKIAFVGAGGFSTGKHLPALSHIKDVKVAAVCDANPENLASAAAKFNIPEKFSDFRVMLDQVKPDAVYAVMAPHRLFDVALETLQRGIHLFVEKPPAVTTAQTLALARVAQRHRCITAVAFQRRYHRLLNDCVNFIKSRSEIRTVRVDYHKFYRNDGVEPYYGGAIDILHCDAIHAVDAARFYSGLSPVSQVSSFVRNVGTPYPNAFQALVAFDNGVTADINADWAAGRRDFKFEFYADGLSAQVDIDSHAAVWSGGSKEPVWYRDLESDDLAEAGFIAENQAFIDAVISGVPPHNNLADAALSMKLADMIYNNSSI